MRLVFQKKKKKKEEITVPPQSWEPFLQFSISKIFNRLAITGQLHISASYSLAKKVEMDFV